MGDTSADYEDTNAERGSLGRGEEAPKVTIPPDDEDIFKAVEKFAAKYGMRVLTNDLGDIIRKKTPEEKEQYVIFHEWTDGDQITFFVMKFGDIHRAYNKNTCAAAVDDWEENRPALICKRLLRECIKHGIILADHENIFCGTGVLRTGGRGAKGTETP